MMKRLNILLLVFISFIFVSCGADSKSDGNNSLSNNANSTANNNSTNTNPKDTNSSTANNNSANTNPKDTNSSTANNNSANTNPKDTNSSTANNNSANTNPKDTNNSIVNNTPIQTPSNNILTGEISTNTLLTADKIWILDGIVSVTSGASLSIEAGTTIAGKANSYLIIDKNSKIIAKGTATKPIIFTSAKVAIDGSISASGQWGGLSIIGNAGNPQVGPYVANTNFIPTSTNMQDNSGILEYVEVRNSGMNISGNIYVNGLSLVAVGSATTIKNISINYSSNDCIQIWGGTVNLTDINIQNCLDDYVDMDDGYSGRIYKMLITQNIGNSGIEISGHTSATIEGITINQNKSAKEGLIFFQGDGAGGKFLNSIFNDNNNNAYGVFHSLGIVDINNTSFSSVLLQGSSTDKKFTQEESTGGSAQAVENKFTLGSNNLK